MTTFIPDMAVTGCILPLALVLVDTVAILTTVLLDTDMDMVMVMVMDILIMVTEVDTMADFTQATEITRTIMM
jgi:hypothetical protein